MLHRESGLSWMDNEPLYSHLDRERCVWEFSKWMPVEDWLEQCGGGTQGENHTDTNSINVTVHSAYIQYDYQLAMYTPTGKQLTIVAQINYSTSSSNEAGFLPPPIHTLPENKEDSDGYIFPIAVQKSSSESTILQVYFYSVLPQGAGRQMYTAVLANNYFSSSSTPPALLHADTTGNTSKQIWLLEIVGTVLPMPIPVVFQPSSDQAPPPCELDCAINDDDGALFSLAVASSDGGSLYRPAFKAMVSLQHNPDIVSNDTEPFTFGKKYILMMTSNDIKGCRYDIIVVSG